MTTSSLRPDLTEADPREVTDYLVGLGWTDVATNNEELALLVECEGDRDLEADLDAFVPTPNYRPTPAVIKTHLGHLKFFRDEVRSGAQAAKPAAERLAQLEHGLADLIDWTRLTDDRL